MFLFTAKCESCKKIFQVRKKDLTEMKKLSKIYITVKCQCEKHLIVSKK